MWINSGIELSVVIIIKSGTIIRIKILLFAKKMLVMFFVDVDKPRTPKIEP